MRNGDRERGRLGDSRDKGIEKDKDTRALIKHVAKRIEYSVILRRIGIEKKRLINQTTTE